MPEETHPHSTTSRGAGPGDAPVAGAGTAPGNIAAARIRRAAVLETLLVFLVFLIHAGWPVPEMNEPHYLSKAKHYWNPAWCERDFFLGTADAHQVFYWSIGWLSSFLPLPAMAWTGRLMTWMLMAMAWRRLAAGLSSAPLAAALSAGLFGALNYHCQMAGEWVVGGLEAKGFAYALVFLALSLMTRGRWRAVPPVLGAATAFHVLVGGWSLVAAAIAWSLAGRNQANFRQMLPYALAGAVLALPGVVPAMLLSRGVNPDVLSQANVIYVFERLPHHLVPQTFPLAMVGRHAALIAAWGLLCALVPQNERDRPLRIFVWCCIGFAVVGVGCAILTYVSQPLAASLLRFYWFRMSDAIVPIGVALLAVRGIERLLAARSLWSLPLLATASAIMLVHLGDLVLERHRHNWPRADDQTGDAAEWRQTCLWVRDNTPPSSRFLVPRLSQTFRWYAERAEVVTRKDLPQDAVSIVEWHRRLHDIYEGDVLDDIQLWNDNLAALGTERVVSLGRKYEAQYMIGNSEPPLALERVGPSNSFAVYRLPAGRPPAARPPAGGAP